MMMECFFFGFKSLIFESHQYWLEQWTEEWKPPEDRANEWMILICNIWGDFEFWICECIDFRWDHRSKIDVAARDSSAIPWHILVTAKSHRMKFQRTNLWSTNFHMLATSIEKHEFNWVIKLTFLSFHSNENIYICFHLYWTVETTFESKFI